MRAARSLMGNMTGARGDSPTSALATSSSSDANASANASTPSTRRAIFSSGEPTLRRPQPQPLLSLPSPLDLVAQLRGDFEAYTREVYGEASGEPEEERENDPSAARDGMRERRQQERVHLDSLHARLHGLRLILAMAQLNAAASQDMGERVELGVSTSSDQPSVVLLTMPRNEPPSEPQGVPADKLEDLLPKRPATGNECGECCSICICDVEKDDSIRKLACGHFCTRLSLRAHAHAHAYAHAAICDPPSFRARLSAHLVPLSACLCLRALHYRPRQVH